MTPIYKSPAGEKIVMALYNTALEHWAVPFETLTIPTRHGSTFVIISGETASPALILLHGAGTNSAIWAGDVAEYVRRYRVYAIDLLGEAGKSAANRPAWDGPAYAEWLDDVLQALVLSKVTIIGISQGAWTALKFAIYKPECVDKLVLLCPGGIVPDRLSFIFRTILLSLLGQWGTRQIVRMIFARQPIPEGVEEITTLVTRNFKPRLGVLPIFSDDELCRLSMPVLVLGGDEDVLRNNEKIAARLRILLPDLSVTIIPGAGHALLNTLPHILPFLTKSDGSE